MFVYFWCVVGVMWLWVVYCVGVIGALLLPPEGMGAGGAPCPENGGPWPIIDTQNPK